METAGKAFYERVTEKRVIKRPELETPFLPSPEICAPGLACLRLLFAHKLTRSDLEVIITLLRVRVHFCNGCRFVSRI